MRVSDLAAELDVPASLILDQCQRFGIDATWAGAELDGADLVVLRAELATNEAIDLTPADPAPGVEPAAEPDAPARDAEAATPAAPADGAGPAEPDAGSPAPLPPTAVGSIPEIIDEVSPADAGSGDGAPPAAGGPPPVPTGPPTPSPYGIGAAAMAATKAPPPQVHVKRRLESGARTCLLGVIIAALAFAASNFTELAAAVALLWLVAAIALVSAIVGGFRGRRRILTHPERAYGLWVATIGVVVAIAGLIGLTASVMATISDDPASDAPLGVGDLQSVQVARWGYQRVNRFADNGWKQPAREEGSCWANDPAKDRDEDRVELPSNADLTQCDRPHTLEVGKVFAFNRDADAPYPSEEEIVAAFDEQCGELVERVTKKEPSVQVRAEYPTEVGWDDGDHDVACVLLTLERSQPLIKGN